MRTNGRTSSWGGGASMTTAEARGRLRRKYLRNEASPASSLSPALPQPARRTKSARSLSRSEGAKAGVSFEVGAASLAGNGQRDGEAIGGQQGAQPVCPFHQGDAVGARFLPAQLVDLLGFLEAIEVEVPEDAARRVVDLGQGEGRAGHDQA